jgi:hypothetical protein
MNKRLEQSFSVVPAIALAVAIGGLVELLTRHGPAPPSTIALPRPPSPSLTLTLTPAVQAEPVPVVRLPAPASPAPRWWRLPHGDPNKNTYNAFGLLTANVGLDVWEVFEHEPRSEPWASERERAIEDLIQTADLKKYDPDATFMVECHTQICQLRIHSKRKRLTAALTPYPFPCVARQVRPVFGEGDEDTIYNMIFAGEPGDDTLSAKGFRDRISSTCEQYRAQWKNWMQRPGDEVD